MSAADSLTWHKSACNLCYINCGVAMVYIEGGEQAAIACIPAIKEQVFATEDFKEGILSFVERRKARFSGR